MITINKQKYAANEKEFINTLATTKGTPAGYYKRYKTNIKIYDTNKKPIGLINRFGVIIFIPTIENKINYKLTEMYKDVQRIKKTVEYINHESNYKYK